MSTVRLDRLGSSAAELLETDLEWTCNSFSYHKFSKFWNEDRVLDKHRNRWLIECEIQKLQVEECPVCATN